MVRVGRQKYKTTLKFCYFHIYIYIHTHLSQIWLNLQLNDRHFGSITKLTQKKKKKKQCVTVTVRRGSCSGPLPLLPRRTHPSAVVDRDALGTRNPVERSSRALCRASPCSRLLPGPHFSPFSLSLSLSLSLSCHDVEPKIIIIQVLFTLLCLICAYPRNFTTKNSCCCCGGGVEGPTSWSFWMLKY
jgi:hypothetical protein